MVDKFLTIRENVQFIAIQIQKTKGAKCETGMKSEIEERNAFGHVK